jgi:enoyl-CoA hydratase
MTRSVESLPQPVIAAVNGFAMGGGCELALAADIRLASGNAVFGQPEVGLGIPPGWGGTQRLTRLVGPGLAAEIILSGRRVKAEEALRIGLVNAIYPQAELIDRALEMAASIAKNSPVAVRSAKRLMQLAFNGQVASGLDTELHAFADAFLAVDQREGMAAFVEKRTPDFLDD